MQNMEPLNQFATMKDKRIAENHFFRVINKIQMQGDRNSED